MFTTCVYLFLVVSGFFFFYFIYRNKLKEQGFILAQLIYKVCSFYLERIKSIALPYGRVFLVSCVLLILSIPLEPNGSSS